MIIKCHNCGWQWNLSKGGSYPYVCNKCGMNNKKYYNNKNIGKVPLITNTIENTNSVGSFLDNLKDYAKTSLKSNIDYASKGGPSNPAATVEAAIDTVKNLISLFANKPNPNDWQGYDASDKRINAPIGTNAINWIINDGDSVQNEALNVVRYIQANGTKNILGPSTWFNRTITIEDVADKLSRGGFGAEAAQLVQQSKGTFNVPGEPGTTKAGMNIWVTLGIVGAGIFLISKMKK